MPEINTFHTDEITCPYCGYEMSDSWEAPDSGDEICPECNKKFFFERNMSITYTTRVVSEVKR